MKTLFDVHGENRVFIIRVAERCACGRSVPVGAMKDLGAKAFTYGHASAVLMAATCNDDGTVNGMNLHEVARTNAGDRGQPCGDRM